MEIWEQIIESVIMLKLNKMRTGLAMLGIIIGIGSVIALMSIGQSSQKAVQDRIQSLGSNLLTISPSSQRSGMVRGASNVTTLTLKDAESIASSSEVTTVKYVSPEYSGRSQIVTGENNTNTSIIGVEPVYTEVHNLTVASGSFITDAQVASMAKVAVLGPTVAEDLFGDTSFDAIGQIIRIGSQNFTVIGITTAKGGSGMGNQDSQVYVPLSTAQKQLFGVNYLSSIAVEANSAEVMDQAVNEIGYLLMARHKFTDTTKVDFRIQNQEDILSTVTEVSGTMTSLLSGIAAISLIVGGIGIMNIMLVTVTERTREIGLRKALGAKKKTIITQFLTESAILTFVGGIIGIIVGISASYVYAKVNSSIFTVSPSSVALAFVVSVAIGILFGWYPARRAANLQPIEALRYE
ncbi:MAG: ABC transporter permease [Candidatus Shapirobacteria bacterium]